MSTLSDDIAAFIQKHSLTERQFGLAALNDPHLVRQLRGEKNSRPRRIWPETEARIRAFMDDYRHEADAA
jgi:hypothetical protein